MTIADTLRFADSHEWVLDNGDGTVTIGISDHAQQALGDVVYVELPEIDAEVSAGAEFALVESVKAASDVYSPVSGTVLAVNDVLESAPETVNESCYQDGWMVKLKLSQPDELSALKSAAEYQTFVEQEA